MVGRRMTTLPDALLRHTLQRCDRTASATARKSLQRIVWRYNIPLLSGCIFHPDSDVLAAQELSKERLSASLWRCTLCGKQFISEYFLNMHHVNRHATVHSSSSASGARGNNVCLADLCGIIVPCPASSDPPIPVPVNNSKSISSESPCTSETERKLRHTACVRTVRTCDQSGDPEIAAYLESRLCDAAYAVECGKSVPHPVPYPHRYAGLRLNSFLMTVLLFICTIFSLFSHRRRLKWKGNESKIQAAEGKLPSIWDKEKKVR